MDVIGAFRRIVGDFRIRRLERATPHHRDVPGTWMRRPMLRPEDEVCLFVALAPAGTLSPHSVHHAAAWHRAGLKVVVTVVVADAATHADLAPLDFAAGILVRPNVGYDFGAWAAAIGQLPELRDVALLATVNDSVYGPLDAFGAMLDAVRAAPADVIGATESFEGGRHFQSFLLFFKPRALASRAFRTFWGKVRSGDRAIVIHRYERRIPDVFERAGLCCLALFPGDRGDPRNPTLFEWRELVARGFPFLKVQLLRDNPNGVDLVGWEDSLRGWGYDPVLALGHLGRRSA